MFTAFWPEFYFARYKCYNSCFHIISIYLLNPLLILYILAISDSSYFDCVSYKHHRIRFCFVSYFENFFILISELNSFTFIHVMGMFGLNSTILCYVYNIMLILFLYVVGVLWFFKKSILVFKVFIFIHLITFMLSPFIRPLVSLRFA